MRTKGRVSRCWRVRLSSGRFANPYDRIGPFCDLLMRIVLGPIDTATFSVFIVADAVAQFTAL